MWQLSGRDWTKTSFKNPRSAPGGSAYCLSFALTSVLPIFSFLVRLRHCNCTLPISCSFCVMILLIELISRSGVYSILRNVSKVCLSFSFWRRSSFLLENGTCCSVSFNRAVGYPLSLNKLRSLSETFWYMSLSEQALRSLISSPLTKFLNVPLGCAEVYFKYWNLFVGLKNGFVSSMSEDWCLLPL